MRYALTTALCAALATAVPAAAQTAAEPGDADRAISDACMAEIQSAGEDLNREGMTIAGEQIRTLHHAAIIFGQAGQDEACRAVVAGIRDYIAARQEARARSGAPAADQDWRKRVQEARPIDKTFGPYRVSDLIGADVVTPTGDELGDVDDIVLSMDGTTRYLLIGTGGFLQIGETHVPVEMSRFRLIDDDTLVLEISKEAFDKAPRVDLDAADGTLEAWSEGVTAWWDEQKAAVEKEMDDAARKAESN